MAYTQHYNLPLTADSESTKKFLDWRKEVNGTSEDSAMNKIDGILHDISDELQPATPLKNGLMSADDKTKLNSLESNIIITGNGGVAAGTDATASAGGSIGKSAEAFHGGSVGAKASSVNGGAVGSNAKTGNGFAGGLLAKTVDDEGTGIDAIQLGSGTNSTAKTLQVYGHQMMDADGHIPAERMINAPVSGDIQAQLNLKADKQNKNGGFASGENAKSLATGGAIGGN